MKRLLPVLLAFTVASCNPDDSVKIKNEFIVDGNKFDVASVGCFCPDDVSGYDIVFTESLANLSGAMYEAPSGMTLVLDIPVQYTNGEFDISEMPAVGNWILLVSSWNGSTKLMETIVLPDYKSGKLKSEITSDSIMIDFSASYVDGKTIAVTYSGKYTKSDEYIYNWDISDEPKSITDPKVVNRNQ